MREFGSEYHRCDAPFHGEATIHKLLRQPQLYANGRMALEALIREQRWHRLWVPAYFCHEVLQTLAQETELCLYDDCPTEQNDQQLVRSLPYRPGDALLRMNYFGWRSLRTNTGIPVPVIEDHSHALTSDWALHSDADWCIASLRKSLPLAMGGVLWSPKGLAQPAAPAASAACDRLADERYRAMDNKAKYLLHGGDKQVFRTLFIATEEALAQQTGIAAIDPASADILSRLDLTAWNEQRRRNIAQATRLLTGWQVADTSTKDAFSLVVLMPDEPTRDKVRTYLIEHNVYPAVLWHLPENVPFEHSRDFSRRMLSIHCDARYNRQDITELCGIINRYDTNH